ncbi:MAG: class I SAM-dependent methyltransferase [Deltaproteobacteria bacterium]|nr:class I SAM-dependent methyltransferase [Deltaproteobacteria bacterium]
MWTPEKVSRLWAHIALRDTAPGRYFSASLADSVIRFASRHGARLNGRVLDYGCGPGFLLQKLGQQGITCDGLDFSEESAALARVRMARAPGAHRIVVARGLPTPLAGESYDVVFLIETVEHLLEHELEATVGELARLLRPRGTVVVTTPNAEDLEAAEVLCPDCGCMFHGMQHVRSFTSDALRRLLEKHGLRTRFCAPRFFDRGTLASRLYGAALRLAGLPLPHLAYVGERR